MSDQPPTFDDPAGPGVRPTSVDLRRGADAAGAESLMDPAAKSLADALRITYRLLQLAMVVLIALFALSGFKSVNQGERAIRLLFGARSGGELDPGFHMSAPHPFGELITVQTAAPLIALDGPSAFWPSLAAEEQKLSVAELAGGGRDALDPVTDGSLITSDGFIAHVKATVKYRRESPTMFVKNLDPDSETDLVKAAAKRGIVRAAASMTMDQLLSNQGVETIAKAVAQQTLDDLQTGLYIEQFSVGPGMPPRHVANNYNLPQSAESERAKSIQDAQAERAKVLNAAAGEAADALLVQIDRYAEQLRLGDKGAAERTQGVIDRLLVGEPVEVDGQTANPQVFGRVKQLLQQADLDRKFVKFSAETDAARFKVIRRSYAANPSVVLTGEWTGAYRKFLERDSVQMQVLPPGIKSLILMVNKDPQISKEQYEKYWQKKNLENLQKARQQQERERLERPVPTTATSG